MYISAFSVVDIMGIRKKYEQKDIIVLFPFWFSAFPMFFNDVSHCFQNC